MDKLLRTKLDIIRCFMELEGDLTLNGTLYKKDGGVEYSGYKNFECENKNITIAIDSYTVRVINDCDTVKEIYELYLELEFFENFKDREENNCVDGVCKI